MQNIIWNLKKSNWLKVCAWSLFSYFKLQQLFDEIVKIWNMGTYHPHLRHRPCPHRPRLRHHLLHRPRLHLLSRQHPSRLNRAWQPKKTTKSSLKFHSRSLVCTKLISETLFKFCISKKHSKFKKMHKETSFKVKIFIFKSIKVDCFSYQVFSTSWNIQKNHHQLKFTK